MTKNPFKLKTIDLLPFFGVVEKGCASKLANLTSQGDCFIQFLKNFTYFSNITSFLSFKDGLTSLPDAPSNKNSIFAWQRGKQMVNNWASPKAMLEGAISISINFINSLETEFIYLKKKRLQYNPNKNYIKIQKAFHKENKIELITESAFFLKNCSIFYFLPFWVIYFPISFLSHFGNWTDRINFFKPSVFVSNYRIRTRTSITSNCKQLNSIQFVIALFPFIFSFSFLIRSRYKGQLFSYLVKDTLPGLSLSHQNLSWETFLETTSRKINYFSNEKSNSLTQKYNYKTEDQEKQSESASQTKENNLVNQADSDLKEISSKKLTNSVKTNGFEKPKKLQNQNFIKRLDISSNFILLEMKPVWEQQQKQFYIGFLPKKNQNTLNKSFHKTHKLTRNEIVHISNSQIKSTKSEDFSEHKFYARKQNFLRFHKDKIDLKATLINKQPNLINVFSKQQFQQKLFDLDELPLKLDQNYSEVLFSKTQENQKSLLVPSPNLFETLQTFPNSRFTSDLLRSSFNKKIKINNIENGIASQTKLLNFSSEENENEKLFLGNKPEQIQGKNPVFVKDLVEISHKDNKEDTFYKKLFLENELKKVFYNEGFSPSQLFSYGDNLLTQPFEHLQKHTDLLTSLDPTYSFTIRKQNESKNNIFEQSTGAYKTSEEEIDLSAFAEKEKNNNDGKEFNFFDSIQAVILNLEKNHINLNLPEQSDLISSRLLSGYLYPDTKITNLRSSRIQNLYKNLIFQKQNKEILSMKIELPSSFLTNSFAYLDSISALTGQEGVNSLYPKHVLTIQSEGNYKIEDFFKFPQLNFHYLPNSNTLLNQSLIEKINIGGIYQKVPTIYKQEINLSSKSFPLLPQTVKNLIVLLKPFLYFQKPFRDSWEPVTIQSWLVITKFSFAFIALKVFQSLLLNYGKELVFLGFLDDNLKEEFGLTDKKKDKGYRLIKKVKKRFKDVAGIDNILPELGEMVWVLRNSGRSFKVGRVLPKGFLFVGPPGTGKTLLVQAIAGEAEVPVLVQSGSSLTDAGENEKGAQRLKKLFEQARKVAPCIVFIDEIDTLGESRQNVMSNNVGADDLIQSLHKSNQGLTEKSLSSYVNTDKPGNITEKKSRGGSENLQHNSSLSIGKKNQAKQQANQEQLNLLMQFLVELDGLKSRAGIIVIGATNRPKVLDPALTRPGRFDRLLNLEFPGKRKRIEILKLYSQNIGLDISSTNETNFLFNPKISKPSLTKTEFLLVGSTSNDGSFSNSSNTNNVCRDLDFPWEYLANRTFGFSAADLAAAMNQSSIQAILRNTGHTIETIEQGIEFITTYSIEKPKIESTKEKDLQGKTSLQKDPFFVTRFAYYQAGKAVLHTLLPQHPDAVVLKLWPQPKNSRHKNGNLHLTSINHRAKLETHLIGLYAGKAGELVALSLNSQTKKQITYTKKIANRIKENKEPNRKTVPVKKTQYVRKVTSPKQTLLNQRIFLDSASSNIPDITNNKQKNQQVHKFSQYNKRNLWHSTLGIEDLSVASNLAHSLVEKWHFYSNKIGIRRENQIVTNQNQFEISEIEIFDLFQQLTQDVQNRISASNISESHVREGRDKHSRYNYQEWSIRPWWQNQITEQTGNLNMFYDDWYRIYLPDPEESERNEEWVTPDEYYHNTQNLKNFLLPKSPLHRKNSYLLPTFKSLKNPEKIISELFGPEKQETLFGNVETVIKSNVLKEKNNRSKNKNQAFGTVKNCQIKKKLDFDLTWNDLYKLDRDYIYHALILTCFNKAFSLLDENRELLDYLADYLMRFETVRQHKIKEIFQNFGHPNKSSSFAQLPFTITGYQKHRVKKKKTEGPSSLVLQRKRGQSPEGEKNSFKKDKQEITFIFDKNWGKNSRRNFSRFFSFDQQRTLSKKRPSHPFTFFDTINE